MIRVRDYQNKNWLFEYFITKGKTVKEIANICDVSESTIAKWTTVFNLRKMHHRDKYVLVECAICGKEQLRLRRYHNAHLKQGRSHFYCGKKCFGESRRRKIKALNMYLAQERPETSIEIKIREVLESIGINFRVQEKIAFWAVDFYLPEQKLVIEANGDYWHANPELYKPNELNEKQQERIRNDHFKIHGLQYRGYQVLVLWENDINKRIDWCVNQIKESIGTAN